MKNTLFIKLKESFFSVIPIAILVTLLGITITPLSAWTIATFWFAVLFLIIGMALFSIGSEIAMIPIGEKIGNAVSKTNKLWFILLCTFILGTVITFAEPDLNVLASQVTSVDKNIFILTVSLGVGVFLIFSILRNVFKMPLSVLLAIAYGVILIMIIFVPEAFVPLSFDAGSVTTGPVSMPFILAFGVGVASMQGRTKSEDSDFGMIALSSVGPIFATMLIGIILRPNSVADAVYTPIEVDSFGSLTSQFFASLPIYLKEIAFVMLPIVVIILIFQLFKLKMNFKAFWKIIVGVFYAYIGITLYLCAVQFGFLFVGNSIGQSLANLDYNWIIMPLMFIIGFIIVFAEPAVYVLTKQIEAFTSGIIKAKTVKLAMCFGVAIALFLVALRIMYNINLIWFIVPLYLLTIILSFVVPKVFTGIAYDSGGVTAGAMSSTFVLPMVIGIVMSFGESVMLQAFGTLALVAGLPILSLLIVGVIYKHLLNKANARSVKPKKRKVEIVEFDR